MKIKSKLEEYKASHPNSRVLINTIFGELDRLPHKNHTDEDCIKIIKKMIEGNKLVGSAETLSENEVLEQFIPKQLNENEIKDIILKNSFNSIKDCMIYFKEYYTGLYGGKLVSKLFSNK